jgi:tRNA-Thr(GGU) m(6)t(6)A37 methyltransferase TsaA
MNAIGIIHTEYKKLEDMPIQPKGASKTVGRIILNQEYQDGLLDLDGFSHIYLIYIFHLSKGYSLRVRPFLDDKEHGVFATRAPSRPNPIGLSVVKLLSVKNNIVEVEGADLVDGTPILDIKPYIEQFDKVEQSKSGWLNASDEEIRNKKSDHRFK